MTPKLKSCLAGGSIGAVVFGALAAFPFAPLEVAVGAGVAIGVPSILLVRSIIDKRFLLGKQPEPDVDDGSGERPVWSAVDVKDRLSPHSAWMNGHSILPHGDDTQEMPAPFGDQTHILEADRVFGYNPRHGAGVR